MMEPITFDAEFKGISTGRTLGEDRGGAILCKMTLEGNATELPLATLVALQKAGTCTVTIQPKQLELKSAS